MDGENRMNTQRHVVLDTETTGFKPEEGHRVIEIGAVELYGFQKGRSYQQYINPERDIPEASFQVHGLSQKFLQNKPVFADVVTEFLSFIEDSTLLIHNQAFDMSFINHHLAELGYAKLSNQVIDTIDVARKKYPGQSNSLDSLCRRFNINLDDRKQHGALKDSILLTEVWLELHGGRQTIMDFNHHQHPTTDSSANDKSPNHHATKQNNITKERSFPIDKAELEQHEKLLATKIPNNIWEGDTTAIAKK
ncbi:MAG: DNA polymerase III subunit epsilon [Alphaproteobacteria bacterium]